MASSAAAVRRTTVWVSVVVSWWVFAGLLSRSTVSYGWTELCFGTGLALTYLALWAIVTI